MKSLQALENLKQSAIKQTEQHNNSVIEIYKESAKNLEKIYQDTLTTSQESYNKGIMEIDTNLSKLKTIVSDLETIQETLRSNQKETLKTIQESISQQITSHLEQEMKNIEEIVIKKMDTVKRVSKANLLETLEKIEEQAQPHNNLKLLMNVSLLTVTVSSVLTALIVLLIIKWS